VVPRGLGYCCEGAVPALASGPGSCKPVVLDSDISGCRPLDRATGRPTRGERPL